MKGLKCLRFETWPMGLFLHHVNESRLKTSYGHESVPRRTSSDLAPEHKSVVFIVPKYAASPINEAIAPRPPMPETSP